jgi:hypothetical protein
MGGEKGKRDVKRGGFENSVPARVNRADAGVIGQFDDWSGHMAVAMIVV